MNPDFENIFLMDGKDIELSDFEKKNINSLSFLINEENYLYEKRFDPDNNFIRRNICNYIYNIMKKIDKVTFIDRRNLEFITRYLDMDLSTALFRKIKNNYLSLEKDGKINEKEIVFKILKTSYDLIKDCIFEQVERINTDNNDILLRLAAIKDTFRLKENEVKVLIYEYIFTQDSKFNIFVNNNSSTQKYNGIKITSLHSLSTLLDMNLSDVKSAYSRQSNIVKCNLLKKDTEIADELVDYLNGFSDKPLTDNYFSEIKYFLDIEDFSIDKEDIDIINNLIKNRESIRGVKILFYGQPGTGKTEFARTISNYSGNKTLELKSSNNGDDKENDKDFKFRALSAYENYFDVDNSILIVDEADEMLSTNPNIFGSYNNNMKGKINQYLDESVTNQIWITNSIMNIDESTKRRFDYCLKFDELTEDQRFRIWKNILKEYKLNNFISESEVLFLAEKYDCNAGNIRNAVRNFIRINKNDFNAKIFNKIVDKSLSSYITLVDNNYISKKNEMRSAYRKLFS